MLLTQDKLLDRLKLHLRGAERVDVAMAWTSTGEALDAVIAFAKRKPGCLRTVVGITGIGTQPQALRLLQTQGELRIPETTPLFHPKLILFYGVTDVTVWIGSANLTRAGFQQNTEVMAEFKDDGTAVRWFDDLWEALPNDSSTIIDDYEDVWEPTSFPPRDPLSMERPIGAKEYEALKYNLSDWASYVTALQAANLYCPLVYDGASVYGESTSWLNTITLGNEIIRRDNWDTLSKHDYKILMGLPVSTDGYDAGYGLLGSMGGAGDAKKVFNEDSEENLHIRGLILAALQPVLAAVPADFPEAATDFISEINEIKGFSGGLATRFLALARPDLAVSVNDGSRRILAAISGLPQTTLSNAPKGPRAKSYADLLAFLQAQQWYSNPTPRGAYEQTLADNRAALIDCLVYQPVNQADVD